MPALQNRRAFLAGGILAALCLWVFSSGLSGAAEEAPGPPKSSAQTSASDPRPKPAPKPKPKPKLPEKNDAPAEAVEIPDPDAELPGVLMDPSGKTVLAQSDLRAVRLEAEAAEVPPGQAMRFVLRGPESFLKAGLGRLIAQDEYEREFYQGLLKLAELQPDEDGARHFRIPTRNAVGSEITLRLDVVGADDRRLTRKAVFRIRRPWAWRGWITLLHAPYPEGHWRALEQLGVRGGMAYRMNETRLAELRAARVPFYVENIARQFLSRYHAERGLWEKTVKAQAANPEAYAPLVRKPSLCSRAFARAYAKELKRHAKRYRGAAPLFYSLAAEPSVTRLAAAFDFDFHPEALREFRRWLERDVYGTLPALNKAWGTRFARWEAIVPMTTAEARLRLKDKVMNFAPWADFREFQDHVFAKVLREGRRLIRQVDSQARVGITGAMGPFAFGGWDWSRLAGALDVVEAYDIGCARALWRDLAPGKPALAMIPLAADLARLREARRTLWTLALDGAPRGVLLWDEAPSPEGAGSGRVLLDATGKPTLAAEVLAPTLRELAGPLGLMLALARREPAQVGLLYSPASVRLHWLFEAERLHGDGWRQAWGARTALERRESPQLKLRISWSKLLSDLGLPWRFLSSAELAGGKLRDPACRIRTLVLPQAAALGPAEVEELERFTRNGGTLVADAFCGHYDDHGRKRKRPALDELFGVDSSREPLSAEPERPLAHIRDASEPGSPPFLDPKTLDQLAPVYSDKPAWRRKPPARRCEYRKSPVLARRPAGQGAAVYLNLDLSDYLHWRLEPGRPRARRTRAALARVAFARVWEKLPERIAESSCPAGTELIRLRLGEGEQAPRLLALRRNVQERLHEVGREGDRNRNLEKAERFKLLLRKEVFASDVLADRPALATKVLEGTLDPVTPALFVLRAKGSPPPAASAPESVRAGDVLSIRVVPAPGAAKGPRIYGLRVKAPDGTERAYYRAVCLSPGGSHTFKTPIALNDLPGVWTFTIRDATTGLSASLAVEVQDRE